MEVPSFLSPLAFENGLCRVGRGVTVCVVVVRGCGSNYAHQESRTRITRCPDHQVTPYPTHPSAPILKINTNREMEGVCCAVLFGVDRPAWVE